MSTHIDSVCAVDETAHLWSNLLFLFQLLTLIWLLKLHVLFGE